MKPRHWILPALLASATACDVLGPGPTPTTLTILGGDAQTDTIGALLPTPLSVEVRDQDGEPMQGIGVDWTTPDSNATVTAAGTDTDANGRASATVTLGLKAGAATVEARVKGGLSVAFDLTALAGAPALVEPSVDSITLDAVGDSAVVEATVFDRGGNEIADPELTWSTSDSTVVRLAGDGRVRSVAPGHATLTIRAADALGTVPVAVIQRPHSVAITPSPARLTAIAETLPLTATAYDRNGHAIDGAAFDWTSAATDVATVSSDGLLTAVAPGETTITAGVGDVEATTTARVEQEVARVVLEVPSDTLREPGDTLRARATAQDRNGYEVPDVTFTWESRRPSVAVVDATGLVTARNGRGDAPISATADGVEERKNVTRIPWGVLVLTFDDAFRDVYTRVRPLLEQHGIKANIALPTGYVGQTIGGYPRLTEGEIADLHGLGWSIVPHSIDHPDLTRLPTSEVHRQLRESQKWVQDRGYRGHSVFIVPLHRWNEGEREAVASYYDAARGHGIDHHRHGGMVDWPPPNPYLLTSIPGDVYFVTEDGRRQMDDWWAEAISKGKFLGTYFHSISADYEAAFVKTIERMVKYKSRIRTYGDLFD